jgi:hypothetical protein
MHSQLSTDRKTTLQRIKDVANLIKVMNSDKTVNITDFEVCLSIVDRLIDFKDRNCTVVDTTCGKGSFLLAVIYRFVENGCAVKYVVDNIIYGYDISESQILHCVKYIKLATGIKPCNIHVKDTMKNKPTKLFTYEVGNYPFNDSSEEAGRSTAKLKENTSDLDYAFYLSNADLAKKRAVIMRAGCLAKSSKVRENIMSDPYVHTILNVSDSFDISPDTMCVIKGTTPVTQKCFVDKNNNEWFYQTDKNTKLSINFTKEVIPLIEKIFGLCEVDNFGKHWLRSPVKRSDSRVNKKTGISFVQITGAKDEDAVIEKYNGTAGTFKSLDKWKVITNVNAGHTSIGNIKIIPPGVATSNSIVYFPFDTEKEAIDAKNFLESSFVKFITPFFKSSAGNSSEFFNNIPYFNFKDEDVISDLNNELNKYI